MKRIVFILALIATFSFIMSLSSAFAQKAPRLTEMRSMEDGEHYTMLNEEKTCILKFSYKTGKVVDTLFDIKKSRENKIEVIDDYIISPSGHHILVWEEKEYLYRRSWQAEVYHYDIRRNYLKPISDNGGKIMCPVFSPNGRLCAFVRDNNLWIKKFDYDTEIQITKDGAFNKILNGQTDWVYEEEFTITHLISWAPENNLLAFLKSDESEVPSHDMQVFDGSLYPSIYTYKYPKAGQNNSRVACYVYNVDTKDTKKMNVPLDEDGYIPMVRFTKDQTQLAVMTLNRHQNLFRMYFVNPKSTVAKLILQDENPYYINSQSTQDIYFSPTHFVYVSEKDGYSHIYLYTNNGVLEKQLTSGNWDVTKLYGFNPETKTAYFQSAEESPLRRAIYKVDSKGKKTKLSKDSGTNIAAFSSTCQYFFNQYSNTKTPNHVTLNDEKGKELQVIFNGKNTINNSLPQKEFITIPIPSGEQLNAWILKPNSFNQNTQYPVLMIQYSGPDSQEVLDKYDNDWYYRLLDEGYLVVAVDGRGTGARGQEFRKSTYLQLGIKESDDQIAAANYLGNLSYVDKSRIGIWGWSYGGFTTLMSMSRGNGTFKAGIAIAPVTDWRFYDSVYTERFMRTPKENNSNYEMCSPIRLAEQMNGKLLLVHGTADDNVHVQNTLYYAEALVEAGKQFDMQIYTNKNHSLLGEKTRVHLYERFIDFVKKNL